MQGLSKPADQELVTVRAIKAQNIGNGFAFRRVDQLTYAHEWLSARERKQLGSPGVGGRGVDFLVGVAELDLVISFEDLEQRLTTKRSGQQIREISGGEIAGLQRERFLRSVAQTLELMAGEVMRFARPTR